MSATFQTLAVDALEDLGCLRPGQTPSTDILNSMLRRTNRMIDAWRIDDLMAYAYPAATFDLVAGQQQYTIGPSGADFTAAFPTGIKDANIILNTVSPVIRRPLNLIDVDRWSLIRVQDLPFAIPIELYFDNNFSAGLGVINLWPGPMSSYQLELFTNQTLPFTSFADLDTTAYSFPPAYEKLMQKGIAAECAPLLNMYCKSARVTDLMAPAADMLRLVLDQFREIKAEVQSNNAPLGERACDPAWLSGYRRGSFNYATGEDSRR